MILSSANLSPVPPEFASIQCDGLHAGYLDSTFSLWDDSVHPCECAQSGFCCPGLLHASVVVLFEPQVGVHPDSWSLRRPFIESDETVSYLDFGSEFRPEMLLVAFPACEKCFLHLCSVELEILSAGPLDAHCCAGFKFLGHLVHVLPGCHPSEVNYVAEGFGFDYLFPPLDKSSNVYRKENRGYW